MFFCWKLIILTYTNQRGKCFCWSLAVVARVRWMTITDPGRTLWFNWSGGRGGVLSIIGESCYKYLFCRNKTHLLSRQNTSFVATKVCLSWQKFCRGKHVFVATKHVFVETKDVFCRDKRMLVETKRLSRQTRVCLEKTFVATKIILVAAPASDS